MGDQAEIFPEQVPWWKKGQAEGGEARDAAIDRVARGREAWVIDCRAAMEALYLRRKGQVGHAAFVNADDAVEWLDDQGYTKDKRIIGAVFRDGWIYIRHMRSRLKQRHARPISCWRMPDE